MQNDPPTHITITSFLKQCLQDWMTWLLHQLSSRPTHVRELVATTPTFVWYVDVYAFGAGGVWFNGSSNIKPTVWRIQFPEYVIANLISDKNPTGTLTNSDLEMAGLLCQWLVLLGMHYTTLTPILQHHRHFQRQEHPNSCVGQQAFIHFIHYSKLPRTCTSHSFARKQSQHFDNPWGRHHQPNDRCHIKKQQISSIYKNH
jgi:hypothetical protein